MGEKKPIRYKNFRNISIFVWLYFSLSIIFLVKLILSGALSQLYGVGQALTSQGAFDPLSNILALRYIFASAYFILNRKRSRVVVSIVLFELLISVMSGGRKAFVIVLLSFLIPYFQDRNIGIKELGKAGFALIFSCYVLLLVVGFRNSSLVDSYSDRFLKVNADIFSKASQVMPRVLNFASSEGVQNWTFQLLEEKQLQPIYGMSYVHALVNVVILRPLQGDLADYQAAYVFKYVAYPKVDNHGYDFTFTAEAILNWGPTLAPLSYFFMALIVGLLYRRQDLSDFWRLMYFSMWPILFVALRTDSTAMFRLLSFYLVVALLGKINIFGKRIGCRRSRNV